MKTFTIFVFLLLCSLLLVAQKPKPIKADTIVDSKGDREKQLKQIKDNKVKLLSDSAGGKEPKKSRLVDPKLENKYGDLLKDDSLYNRKYPLWIPAVEVLVGDVLTWSTGRYIMKASFSKTSISSWESNLKEGWEWDKDPFPVNFVGHPIAGTFSYNASRSNGYNYYQSAGFAVGGSLMWEYFGENTRPSYNDIINTPVNGAFLGEILYRLSSNVLDDRTRGIERASREVLAGLINPVRGFNRLIQGKAFRITNKEVYEKEPLNVSVSGGLHQINRGTTASEMLNIQLDYGNPFEKISRRPFDLFKLRTDLNFGVGKKILDNVAGYGILFGKNKQVGKMDLLVGAFQYYDYWNAKTFELAAIGFGGGLFTRLPLGKKFELYTNIHFAAMPLAGNSRQGNLADTTTVRDYDYGGGMEAKFETTLNIDKYATVSLIYYNYFFNTYVGKPGNNVIGIFKPRVTIKIYKDLNIGFEEFIYADNRHLHAGPGSSVTRSEQKLFLLFYFEDRQRKGRYN